MKIMIISNIISNKIKLINLVINKLKKKDNNNNKSKKSNNKV